MKKIFIIIFVFFTFTFLNAAIVECQESPCSWQDLSNSLINLIKTVVWVSFWIAVLLSIFGSFLLMFHGPRPDLYQKGKNLIKTAIIGYILILLSGIIFDLILEFFTPKLALLQDFDSKIFLAPVVIAAEEISPGEGGGGGSFGPTTFLDPLKNAITEGLKCGKGATSALERIFNCIFEAIALLKNLAVILLTIAIIGSAAYLITTPLFGLKNIAKAYQILIWSIIGLVIILLADVIRAQIERLTK